MDLDKTPIVAVNKQRVSSMTLLNGGSYLNQNSPVGQTCQNLFGSASYLGSFGTSLC
jgi:hypothetical protein